MDDESYFKLYGHQDDGYYFAGRATTQERVKYKAKEKYEPKLLVWMLISPRGASPAVIFPSKQNVDGAYYREWMLTRIVKPFIDCHYPDGQYWFWYDLAPGHTAAATKDVLVALVDNNH